MDTKYLAHHGVKGQRWGVRRYQNKDGSLTEAGKKRLGRYKSKQEKKIIKEIAKDKGKEIFDTTADKYIELEAVRSMTLSDIKREKKIKGKARVNQILHPLNKLNNVTRFDFKREAPKYRLRADRVDREVKKYYGDILNAEHEALSKNRDLMKKYNQKYYW